ncbi:hypothetical protein MGLY_02670 [Neomoorella glycerini]|uniref:Anti-sigma-W factor RsiW n=1 Tax=Neomoorella glycerini TaxID=55779 RepID=A0A6I5ZM98_9FIRM|nr:zf-HC2 domain-containing protein [Moorella glycerini]QGP90946.1 hypothetical protein MGLY_02670 [Moorella glycerini]
MNCSQYRELLSPYLDGALPANQQRDLENHLRRCPFCREELEALRQTVNLLQAWSEEELDLPAGFEERLRSRLEATCRPWYWRLPKSWLSLAAAAAIMVAVALTAYADYFGFPHNFQARQQAPEVTREEKSQNNALQAPVVPVPDKDYAIKILDQQNITHEPERVTLPAAPLAPKREQQPVKSPQTQPVLNGRERSPVTQPGNSNFRGQKQDPDVYGTLSVNDGQTEPGTTPPGGQNGDQSPGKDGGGSGTDNTRPPGANGDRTGIDDNGRPATVPEEVYRNPEVPEANLTPAVTPGTRPGTPSSAVDKPGKPPSP